MSASRKLNAEMQQSDKEIETEVKVSGEKEKVGWWVVDWVDAMWFVFSVQLHSQLTTVVPMKIHHSAG